MGNVGAAEWVKPTRAETSGFYMRRHTPTCMLLTSVWARGGRRPSCRAPETSSTAQYVIDHEATPDAAALARGVPPENHEPIAKPLRKLGAQDAKQGSTAIPKADAGLARAPTANAVEHGDEANWPRPPEPYLTQLSRPSRCTTPIRAAMLLPYRRVNPCGAMAARFFGNGRTAAIRAASARVSLWAP